MFRRVLARRPLPKSLPVSPATRLTAPGSKLRHFPGIHVHFLTSAECRKNEASGEGAAARAPVGFMGKAGEVDFLRRWEAPLQGTGEALPARRSGDGCGGKAKRGKRSASTARTALASAEMVAGLGTRSTVRDYRLAITNAVRKAKSHHARWVMLNMPAQDIFTMTDPYHPPQCLPAAEVVEKSATFAVTAAYEYDRLKSGLLVSADATDATAITGTAAAVAKKKMRRTRGSRSAAHTGDLAPPMELILSSDNVKALRTGEVIGHCINDARNLGNLREDEGIPEFYVEWAKKMVLPEGVKLRKVLRGQQLEEAGLHLMYNVGRGSRYEPYMMVLEYVGNPRSASSTAIVGKGVTFDSGGLNLKPFGSMETMHTDMMGAATALTTLKAIATLQLPINVVAAVGLVENAIGPDSYHPSSILTSLKGLTVEVLNTDAEGRLVLADALTYVQRCAPLEKKPRRIIDLATLTGAIIVGLGSRRAGLFSPSAELMNSLMTSGTRTGEELWPMPIGEEHTEAMRGGIADLINSAPGRQAGSCTAAAFLAHFIEGDVQWAHLDIAGVADVGDKPKGFHPAGVTGYGVQLLVDFLRQKK